ncbi:manganese catalase family protein [Bradyrhizobium sp. 195]|uniref:manganese catalase family protein n=1 Tax=Bradyrhizobium sp. 195 TaxID=2782662 RepID=UPI0020019A49|nr:manganese catalase family protein [Bradyrhizobium sp. 195]UPK31389.1 manganese catalase family protein [Bradyrhizobium sp. 195]
MQEMLSYLIAHDTVHQQQWLAVIDDMGADAALPIPNNFDRSKEATEFSYMFMGTEHHAASIQPGRYCEGSSIDGRGEFSFRAGFEPLVEEPVPGPARPDSGAQVEQMKEPPVTHALTLMVPSASRPPPMGEVAIIACPPQLRTAPLPLPAHPNRARFWEQRGTCRARFRFYGFRAPEYSGLRECCTA